jgi:gamma-glutamyl-gamma-aminobutyrate hydrolase PuuD
MEKPTIGITPDVTVADTHVGPTERLQLNLDYASAVSAAGGIPVVLPPNLEPADALALVDGLLLTGGGDIDPALYGAPPSA